MILKINIESDIEYWVLLQLKRKRKLLLIIIINNFIFFSK